MNVDLNSSLPYMKISDFMARISTIDNTSEKIEKLNIYVKELNVEMLKMKVLECDSITPLSILILTEAIEKLEKEIMWYTNKKANEVAHELMSLRIGDSKGKKRLEEPTDADKKNWMSSIHLGSNNITHGTTNQSSASQDSSSGMIQKDVSAYENPNRQMCINSKKRKSDYVPFQKPPGVIFEGNSNINNGQHSSVERSGLSSFNMNISEGFVTNLCYQTPSILASSKKPRLTWTHDLHLEFLRVVEQLGGPAAATPKKIREGMQINKITNDEIKSHLQKYRLLLQKQYLASNTASVVPLTSRSPSTSQGCQGKKST